MVIKRSTLRTQAKRRADMEHGTFVSDDEWNVFIDNAASELFDLILESDEVNQSKKDTVTLVGGQENYALPLDFFKLQGCYFMNNTRRIFPMRRFNLHELGYAGDLYAPLITGRPYAYDLVGQEIWFYPTPTSSGIVQLMYLPKYVPFPDDTALMSFTVPTGWEEFIAVTCAVKALQKEQSDTSALMMEKQMMGDRIRKRSANRDGFESRHMRDMNWISSRFRRHRLGR